MTELGNITNEIIDALGEAFNFSGTQKIIFSCVPTVVPLKVLEYLEVHGVYAKPALAWREDESGSKQMGVYVRPKQYLYAAGLIEGYAPGSVKVLEPLHVKPINPKKTWGKPVKTKGTLAGILRIFR